MGYSLKPHSGICTLSLMRCIETGQPNKLQNCCQFFGIPIDKLHQASDDAFACAQLLTRLSDELGLPSSTEELRHEELWRMPATPRGITRRTAQRPQQETNLSPLLGVTRQNVALEATEDKPYDAYIDLLDIVLEDRIIDQEEVEALSDLAGELQLQPEEVRMLHKAYADALGKAVFSDGEVTEAEQRDYEAVTRLLGLGEYSLQDANVSQSQLLAKLATEDFRGASVCFTGDSLCQYKGAKLDKKTAEELAREKGLEPKSSVTKKLDILVVSDPRSMSGKAKKARQYGTRIITERAFWLKLGVDIG